MPKNEITEQELARLRESNRYLSEKYDTLKQVLRDVGLIHDNEEEAFIRQLAKDARRGVLRMFYKSENDQKGNGIPMTDAEMIALIEGYDQGEDSPLAQVLERNMDQVFIHKGWGYCYDEFSRTGIGVFEVVMLKGD